MKDNTFAAAWFSDLDTWQQLCKEAQLRASTEAARTFAHKMWENCKQYGLRTYISEPQLKYLCQIVDRVPPLPRNPPKNVNRVAHINQADLAPKHQCPWPRCTTRVPTSMWGCKPHWFKLPQNLRTTLWREYEPGQSAATQTEAYKEAAAAIEQWIKDNADQA